MTARRVMGNAAGRRISLATLTAALAAAAALGPASASAAGRAQPAVVQAGGELCASTFDGHGGMDVARAVTVSPDGQMVFVTGITDVSTSSANYATVAYNAATGAKAWATQYAGRGGINGSTHDGGFMHSPLSMALAPGGICGSTAEVGNSDYSTVGYQT